MKKIILLLFIALCGLAYASSINEVGMTVGNVTINDSGQFYSNTKAFARTADVVVCRGQNVLDDLIKTFTCDVVCKSTDTDCTSEIQSALNLKGNIQLMSGSYNITAPVTIFSNTAINCNPSTTINVQSSTAINTSITLAILNDIYINNCAFNGTLPATHKELINFTSMDEVDNIQLTNLKIYNWNGTAIKIYKTFSSKSARNIKIDNLELNEVLDGIQIREVANEGANKIINVQLGNIYFNNTQYYTPFYSGIGNVIYLIGGTNINVYNIYSSKAADGPAVRIDRTTSFTISNVQTALQHDYAVSLDSDAYGYVTNIKSKDVTAWGPLVIQNTNYADGTSFITANAIYCDNCSNSGSSSYPIYINQNKNAAPPIRNVRISNFGINGSSSFGAIAVMATKGAIQNLYLGQGDIQTVGQAGIFFGGTNETSRPVIENINFVDTAQTTTDNDKKTGIVFYNANITNAKLDNIYMRNTTNITLYIVRILATSPYYFSGTINNIYDLTDTGIANKISISGLNYILSSQQYTQATPINQTNNPCALNNINDGKIQFNTTAGCKCIAANWKCWTIA